MNVYLTLATRYGLNILGLLGVSAALYLGSSIFIPLVIAGLLAAILYPAAVWIHERSRLPWFFACLGVMTLVVVFLFAVFLTVAASVPQIINRLPDTEQKWEQAYEKMARRIADISPFSVENAFPPSAGNSPFYQTVRKLFSTEQIAGYLGDLTMITFHQMSRLVMVLFIILFLLLEGELLAKKVRAIFGTSVESDRRVSDAISEMVKAIRTYLLWRTLINIILGLLVGLAYNIAGLDQWYLWAVLTAVLNYVPYIGTIAAGVPPVAEALIGGHTETAFGIVVGYTLLVTFEGYWIVPRVMGKTMDLNATTVLVACLYWHLVWGIAGLFLAMPLMAAIKAVLHQVEGWRSWGDLMSSVETTPASPPPEDNPQARLAEIAATANNNGGDDATIVMDEPATPNTSLRTP